MRKEKDDKIIAAVAKLYGLDGKNPPDVTDPVVSRAVDERIAARCRTGVRRMGAF